VAIGKYRSVRLRQQKPGIGSVHRRDPGFTADFLLADVAIKRCNNIWGQLLGIAQSSRGRERCEKHFDNILASNLGST
jgi:hypothetical protein